MANPNAATINTTLANGIKPTGDIIADAATIVTSIDTAQLAVAGDFQTDAVVSALAAQRAAYSAAINPEYLRTHWRAWALERFRLAGYPLLDPNSAEAWYRLHRILHESTPETFNDRDLTVAAAGSAGGSNVGTGTLSCLAVDWEGYNLQLPTSETKTWECIQDQNLGVDKHAEVFQVRGEDASKDLLDETGSGIRTTVPVMYSGLQGPGGGLQNPSFDAAHVGSGTDKIPGWTIAGTAANLTEETTNVWRTEPGVSTSRSIEIAAGSDTISQALSVQRMRAVSEWTPWMLQLAYKKTGASDTGTITLHCGSKSEAFNIATPANTTWNVIRLALDKDLYYRNWIEDAADVKVQWTSTSDVIWIDSLMFAPMTYLDGLWYWLTGGATAFLRRDVFTHAVSGGTWPNADNMNALRWAARSGGAFGSGLPVMNLPVATSAGETISDA